MNTGDEWFIREMAPLIEKYGCIPPIDKLKSDEGRNDLANYIYRHYNGGVAEAAKILGTITTNQKRGFNPYGYWDLDKIVEQYLGLHKQKRLTKWLTPIELKKIDSKLLHAINEHGGINRIRNIIRELGINLSDNRKPRGYYKEFRNIKLSVMPFIEQHGHFPSQNDCQKLVLTSLWPALQYHGGLNAVAERLGVPTATEYHKSSLSNWDHFKNEIKPLIKKYGHLPSVTQLNFEGKSDLVHAIKNYYGGVDNAARRLGAQTYNEYHKIHEWSKDKIIDEVLKIHKTLHLTYWLSPSDYKNMGYSNLEAAIRYHFKTHKNMRQILKKQGLNLTDKPRSTKHLIPFETVYKILPELFEEGELKYYLLGLIAADGTIVDKKHEKSVEFCFNKHDYDWLDEIRKRTSPARPIHEKLTVDAVRYKLNTKQLIEMLKLYFTVTNKSLKLDWPRNIPPKYLPHFLRGYFDGDGTIGVVRNQRIVNGEMRYYFVPRLRILGTENFLNGLDQTVSDVLGLQRVSVYKKGNENCFVVARSGKIAKILMDYVYENASIFLERKRVVYDYIMNMSQENLAKNYKTPLGKYNERAKKGEL